jgi:hypothetical protein
MLGWLAFFEVVSQLNGQVFKKLISFGWGGQ